MTKHKYSLKPDVRKPGEKKFADHFFKMRLPQEVDYRSEMPPVWDQGNLGACQSYAIDAITARIKKLAFTPSHIFTYYNVRQVEGSPADEDTGGTLSGTCRAVKNFGICNSDVWPNDNSQFAVKPSEAAYADGKAGNDAILDFYRVETVDEIKQALALGHLPYIGIKVFDNFESEKCMETGVIPAPAGKELGGHALVIVGYHDNDVKGLKKLLGIGSKGYVIIRNSWGTGIGVDGTGYFRCDYEVLEKLLMDMWIIVK